MYEGGGSGIRNFGVVLAIALAFSGSVWSETIEMKGAVALQKCVTQQESFRMCELPTILSSDIKIDLKRQEGGAPTSPEVWTGSWQQPVDRDGITFVAIVSVRKTVSKDNIPAYTIAGRLDATNGTAPKVSLGRASVQTPSPQSVTTFSVEGTGLQWGGAEYLPNLLFGSNVVPVAPAPTGPEGP